MKKQFPTPRIPFVIFCMILLFAMISMACSLPFSGGQDRPGEWDGGEPPMDEPWEEPPHDEPFEEPHMEEPPHDEPFEEPHMEEPQHEEPPMNEPEQHEEPMPESEGMQPEENIKADLAITDIYPDNLPHGNLRFRITNNGPTPLTAYGVPVQCSGYYYSWGTHQVQPDQLFSEQFVVVSLAPGSTDSFDAGLSIDANLYQYEITCALSTDIDPKPGNNTYMEVIPPK
jgi:hypothetical protein